MSTLSVVQNNMRTRTSNYSSNSKLSGQSVVDGNFEDTRNSDFSCTEQASVSVGARIRSGVGEVAKGAAVVTGVSVLGIMAGTTALAVKSYNKKDEICASLGESMSYHLARLLGGNDHMAVQRFQQAGMKGVESAVQNQKSMNRAIRPLPTLNMPVAQEMELE